MVKVKIYMFLGLRKHETINLYEYIIQQITFLSFREFIVYSQQFDQLLVRYNFFLILSRNLAIFGILILKQKL